MSSFINQPADVWKVTLLLSLFVPQSSQASTSVGHGGLKPGSSYTETLALSQLGVGATADDKETRLRMPSDVTNLAHRIAHDRIEIKMSGNVSPDQSGDYTDLKAVQDADKIEELIKDWNRNGGADLLEKSYRAGEEASANERNKKWNKNGVRVWGKRQGEKVGNGLVGENGNDAGTSTSRWEGRQGEGVEIEVKKWNKNGVKLWGKRSEEVMNKKKWNKNGVRVWGKRDAAEVEASAVNLDKKWNKNGVRVWGKRYSLDDASEAGETNKRWNKNGVKVWGKRMQVHGNEKVLIEQGESEEKSELSTNRGKPAEINDDANYVINKKWNKNGVRVWGKRSGHKMVEGQNESGDQFGYLGNSDDMFDEFANDDVHSSALQTSDKPRFVTLGQTADKPRFKTNLSEISKLALLVGDSDAENNNRLQTTKRKWDNNKVRIWGKRNEGGRNLKEGFSRVIEHEESSQTKPSKNHHSDSSLQAKDGGLSLDRNTANSDHRGFREFSVSDPAPASDSMTARFLEDPDLDSRTTQTGLSVSSQPQRRKKRSWREDVGWIAAKRGRSVRSNYNLPEGPKRGWRTNVIRVWGKRGG